MKNNLKHIEVRLESSYCSTLSLDEILDTKNDMREEWNISET